ncbi:uncharacterized protein, partial [Mytilus edulis]|uniref:uncharacterized protein n=1 Tax=Mytilus edulis TaxID=6550 RepID=UPI0039F07B82
CFLSITHIFLQAFAGELQNLPVSLLSKVNLLPELLSESRAPSTTKGYYQSFLRWKKWAILNGIENCDILPAKAFHVAIYLASLTQSSNTASPVVQAFYSLKWIHSLIGSLCSPTDSSLVINVLEGAKRSLATPTNKKEPISVELLHKMYDAMFSFGNLYNQRIICACFTAFAGFLRVSEMLNIRRSDIVILECYMSILIQHSKTDVYRDGNSVLIARTHSNKCPVKNMELYLQWADISCDSDEFIFRNLTKCKDAYVLRKENTPLSYSRMRELFIEAFKPFVHNIKRYGLHSLRSGGASVCANLGLPDRLFKRHGRWRSETAKDGYVKDSLEDLLKVSKNLGL